MTKFGLVILLVLNENSADTPSKALSVSQIMELTKEKLRKSMIKDEIEKEDKQL